MISDINRIIRDLSAGNFRITSHAEQRMRERLIRFEDIRHCADTVRKTKDQGNGKYLIVGKDFDRNELKIVAAWDGETIVITVMGD